MKPDVNFLVNYPVLAIERTGVDKPFISLSIGLMLLATVVLPPFGHLALGTSSMAIGAFFISGVYIFLYFVICAINRQSQCQGTSTFLITAVLGVVMTHDVISFLLNNEFDYYRFWQTYLLLFFFLLGTSFFALLAQRIPNFQADFAVKLVFYVLLLSGVAGVLDFSPFAPWARGRSVLFFSEPSHFALSFLPFLLYMAVTANQRMRLLFVLIGYMVGLLLQNMTLVVGVILITILVVPFGQILFLAPFASLPFLFKGINIDYYSSRISFSIDSNNMSALVHLSGLERACLNFKDTFGFGVGFQQFGIVGSRGEAMYFIEKMAGIDSNLLDGGSVASKFIGEFGFLGLMMLFVYLVYFAKSAIWLHGVSLSKITSHDCKKIFFLSCFVMYCIDLFVRGTGYFSSSGFLFIASLFWIKLSRNSGDYFDRHRNIYT